uniref:Tectonic family member 2 n=1 Tax=Pseudonaja textilis TaxID=8673 RepID=A0A670YT88_PSETE
MSGTMVTASLTNSHADTFSLAVADDETGKHPSKLFWGMIPGSSGTPKTMGKKSSFNVSRVMVSLTRHLQLCVPNITDCCVEPLCLLQSLQVSACQGTKLMARLLIQAEIYANTSSGNLTGKIEENATVIPNQVFHPLGSCPCNLTAGACDVQCCCDEDCTPEMKQLFEGSCFEGVFGGDVNPPFDQLCSAKSGTLAPDWFPFLCVQSPLNNSPFLGYFYDGSTFSSRASSFMLPLQTTPGKPSNGYKQGDPILTVHNDYFTVPQVKTTHYVSLKKQLLNQIYLHYLVGENLCSSANLTPLLFGFNSISGCIMEVSLADNCTQLREDVAARLNSLVQVSHVGKRGNARRNISDNWVEVLRDTNTSEGSLRGICPDVPAHLNIQIITADVGAIEGIPQEEILGVQLSFSTITWQVRCALACPENVTSLPISAAVQFIKVPAQPPVPKTRFQINYTEYDCRRNDVCWPELFYPMTRYYTGEPYSHTLAKGLVLVFFVLLAVVLSGPWNGILRLWKKL